MYHLTPDIDASRDQRHPCTLDFSVGCCGAPAKTRADLQAAVFCVCVLQARAAVYTATVVDDNI